MNLANCTERSEEESEKDTEFIEKEDDFQIINNKTCSTSKNLIETPTNDFECIQDLKTMNNIDEAINKIDVNTATDVIEIHTSRTELDDELDMMTTNSEKKKTLPVPMDYVPRLKGDKGLVIDLETNDVKPFPKKTGVDELLSRFVKNALVKPQMTESHHDIRYITTKIK